MLPDFEYNTLLYPILHKLDRSLGNMSSLGFCQFLSQVVITVKRFKLLSKNIVK